ncbi:T9SS type A sorting domain-containing protein, partial [Arthrospira platensis SPKY1]|nr:T9SS type A sorting domain-containing protein [Arthrospira platensis SPKY1]
DYTLETTDATLNSFEGCVTFIGNTSETPEQSNRLNIYPNPGFGPFHLDAQEIRAEDLAILKIYDSKGKLIDQKHGSWQKLKILQNQLKPGMYLIQIFAEGQYFVNKLVVSAR